MTVPTFLNDPARACRGVNLKLFFSPYDSYLEQAKQICSACDFTTACLQYATGNGERYGVWGGINFTNEDERKRAHQNLGVPERKPALSKLTPKNRRIGREELYDAIRTRWKLGQSDGQIGLQLNISPSSVRNVRTKLGLAPHFGPQGKRLAVPA